VRKNRRNIVKKETIGKRNVKRTKKSRQKISKAIAKRKKI